MTDAIKKEKVKDGWIARDAQSGRLVSVMSGTLTSYTKPKTGDVLREASAKRGHALQRLADR